MGLSPASVVRGPGEIAAMVSDGTKAVFTTSFGLEDQVILHLIAEQGASVEIVTIDTGHLFAPLTFAAGRFPTASCPLRTRPVGNFPVVWSPTRRSTTSSARRQVASGSS